MKNFPGSPNIPAAAWTRPIGQGWDKPYTVRYASNLDDGPWHGMPLGGFGAGCIGRSHRGDFNLWHIDGGEHWFQSMPACQFSVFEQSAQGTRAYALVKEADERGLCPPFVAPLPENPGTYHALYPRSWFAYDGGLQANLVCEQFSPIWAHNYQEPSYPVAVFVWTAHNPTDAPITLSLMLSWENMTGWFTNTLKSPDVKVRDDGSPVYEYQPRIGESEGNFNQWRIEGDAAGCVLGRRLEAPPAEGDGQWAIALLRSDIADQTSQTEVFYHTRWNPTGDGGDLWATFSKDGSLPNVCDETPAIAGERIAAAIALRVTLAPGETREMPMALAWDFPVTEFAEGVTYLRRYTDFFGATGQNAWAIARTALAQYRTWQAQIQQWQQPILDRGDLPDWFKMALFNELYALTDGATLWSAATERDPVGQFAVVECLDYRWYESLDVRLYGSFALLMLFPELDKAVLRAFARAIPAADPTLRKIGYYATQGTESPLVPRKLAGATPHDLGAPNEHPWEKTNYTSYQDCNLWKDLGADFVLQVYRDFVLTGSTDTQFLEDCWPAVVSTLAYLKTFDLDHDGIPENSGAPDQTFDDWRLQGISAYCGGLWIAALEGAIALAKSRGQHSNPNAPPPTDSPETRWQEWLTQSRAIFHPTLWNGQYYRLDSGSGSDVVMADQLCGQFYARLLGLPDVVPEDCARSALKTVYEACFLQFHGGQFGAANGLRPDGSPANPKDTHPLEVWTGINFGLAAFLWQMGLPDEALRLAEAVVCQIYSNGLQFRTPEAITAVGTFRASHYLRAMAIWGIYGVMTDFATLRSP
ncbi:bile acid beta-glucosidase [Thermoleptolyngbya sichuanensis A183]|uniref:Bile acid beta-glucosidase n=1 Tax=Thermoleptolyngbya sichuanensis A183 TaxID=2737172 RepID=A0A6M8BCT1_9CYAN|nr:MULTISPECIES: GH116 family glycosyl hydrolase [Thermoleptolyngbya]QKD81401.1 bile acid beta-glucosidase [Thermoleptolyngbya sichuanensis A183]